jgi:hypothetical protein
VSEGANFPREDYFLDLWMQNQGLDPIGKHFVRSPPDPVSGVQEYYGDEVVDLIHSLSFAKLFNSGLFLHGAYRNRNCFRLNDEANRPRS